MKQRGFSSLLAVFVIATSALAQQPTVTTVRPEDVPESVRKAFEEQQRKKAEAAAQTATPAAPAVRVVPTITSTDPEVKKIVSLLVGGKSAPAGNGQPGLALGAAVVNVDGLDNAVYFDLARSDDLARPFRSGVWHVYRRQGQLRIRQFDVRVPGSSAAFGNLWAVPELLPSFKLDQVAVVLDMPLTAQADGFVAATTSPAPTTLAGATEITSAWTITPAGITFDDKGFDPTGKQVFGNGPTPFASTTASPIAVRKLETGVVIFDIVPPSGEGALVAGGEAAAHYTGWLTTGEQFGTSREVNPRTNTVEPIRFTQGSMIPGFNDAILGLTRGTVRRVFIPAAQGYGPRPRGKIPPNADLIFLIEGLWTSPPKPAPPVAKPDTLQTDEDAKKAAAGQENKEKK